MFALVDNPHQYVAFECNVCHTTRDWHEVQFDHEQVKFSLEGQHNGLACESCHQVADFRRVGGSCADCHEDVHQAKLGFQCQNCHTPERWTVLNVRTSHENTTFPLIGVHARLDCQACHFSEIEGEFSFPRSECYACHTADYQGAQNPQHTEMGFPLRCEECHVLTGWQPANFTGHENFFPIFTGAHAGAWSSCSTCHISPGDFQLFSCFDGCHEHNREKMDNKHREVGGYVYESNACLSCHPFGSGEGDGGGD